MKKLLDFPIMRQAYEYDCGANALQGILAYYGLDVNESTIMKIAKTSSRFGTKIKGLKKVARYFGLKYIEEKNMDIFKLKQFLDKKIPVMILLQAWNGKSKVDWKKDWKDNHYVVAIGYTNNRVYFEDPYSERRTFLSYKELQERWHVIEERGIKRVDWGMAIYRPKKYKKIRRLFCKDFWTRKSKPGFYYNSSVHME